MEYKFITYEISDLNSTTIYITEEHGKSFIEYCKANNCKYCTVKKFLIPLETFFHSNLISDMISYIENITHADYYIFIEIDSHIYEEYAYLFSNYNVFSKSKNLIKLIRLNNEK